MSTGGLSPRALLLVALLALATRGLFELQVHADRGAVGAMATHLMGDEVAYDGMARAFADGSYHRERSFYQEPLYAFVLGLIYRVAPPPPSTMASTPHAGVHDGVILAQHLLGALTCLLIATLGARTVSRRVGLAAGVLAALSGPLIFAESQLLKEGPALLLWVLSLHLWLDLLEDRGRRPAALLGVLLGLGVLLRGNTYILLLLVLATLLLRVGGRRRTVEAALVLGCALLALSPATIHNLGKGEVELSTYQSGSNAAIGMPDDDVPGHGLVYSPLRSGRGDAQYEETDAVELAELAQGRRLSGPEISSYWWGRVFHVVTHRPGVALQRVLLKLASTVHPDEVPDVKDWSFFRGAVPLLSTWLSDLSLCGPLALIGLLLLPWRGRPGLLVLRLSLLAVALTLMLFYVFGRYRLAAAPALWILAAGAVEEVCRRALAARGGRRLAIAGGWALAAGLLVAAGRVPLRADAGVQASWLNVSLIETNEARLATDPAAATAHREAAIKAALRAIADAPVYPDARSALVVALDLETPVLPARRAEGDLEAMRYLLAVEAERTGSLEALRALTAPVEQQIPVLRSLRKVPSLPGREAYTAPSLADAASRASQYLRDGADVPLALELLEESLRLEPNDGETLAAKGLLLRRLKRLPEAEAAYRAALAVGNDSVEVNNNLGNVLILLDRPAEALPYFERAAALEPDNASVRKNLERAREKMASR